MEIISKLSDRIKGYVSFYYIKDSETTPIVVTKNRPSNILENGIEYTYNLFKKLDKFLTEKKYNIDLSQYSNNTSVLDARRVAAHLLTGNNSFKATRIEWGWGSTVPQKTDTDIVGPFSPRVFTNFTSIERPQTNIIKFVSILGNETLNFPSSGPSSPYPFVREVGLKTDAVNDTTFSQNFPNGVLIARHVSDAEMPKTIAFSLGITWIYIYN